MKNISVSPSSLAIGALLTAGLFVVMGQAGPGSYGSWGPPKKGVVNVFHAPAVTVQGGGHVVVYQVPNDRWFTITSAGAATGNCSCPDGPLGALPCLRWAELLGGIYTEKGMASASTIPIWSTPSGQGDGVGWVFRPGSQVVIRNIDASPCTAYDHSFIGYESRD